MNLVFFIYLYQRWIYPVDMSRANEYGCAYAEGEALTQSEAKAELKEGEGLVALPAEEPTSTTLPATEAKPVSDPGAPGGEGLRSTVG
eukprot:TRINITY_DN6149_c0_g1_i1.p1 TRINITY_DN6149_c0_g1~~TRINITY_DN6149_c0_g1_i1.p1  ORF type:complete len:88 (-),score=4.38 TRINITY_DN6149_c0_g1_i1:10-273(-)